MRFRCRDSLNKVGVVCHCMPMGKRSRTLAFSSSNGGNIAPPGPQGFLTESQYAAWPRSLADTFSSRPELFERLRNNLAKPVWCDTDYSGTDSIVESLTWGIAACAPEASPPVFFSSSDNGAPQQEFLMHRSKLQGGKACVFPNLLCRLSPDARTLIEAMEPSPQMSRDARAHAYGEMHEYYHTLKVGEDGRRTASGQADGRAGRGRADMHFRRPNFLRSVAPRPLI